MNSIEFEQQLASERLERYRHPDIDTIAHGFRPVSGMVADFAVARGGGRYHFFYIERRLSEGTPFYPGNEIYFGHASTPDFFEWEVHDPVMLICPGTWEGAHVWAPCILRFGGRFVMAYTGVNERLSQDIGLAFSGDLFDWRRADTNPISPCRGRAWAFWRSDGIASCRDPYVFERDGRVWMAYTTNTATGASCIALTSSADLRTWDDHGPILIGPAGGYEPRLEGGHPQGQLESCCLVERGGRWLLIVNASVRGEGAKCWVFDSADVSGPFSFESRREFWPGGAGVRVVADSADCSLVASFAGGTIRFGEVDWSSPEPKAVFIADPARLKRWAE